MWSLGWLVFVVILTVLTPHPFQHHPNHCEYLEQQMWPSCHRLLGEWVGPPFVLIYLLQYDIFAKRSMPLHPLEIWFDCIWSKRLVSNNHRQKTNLDILSGTTDQLLWEPFSGCPCIHVSFVQTKFPSNTIPKYLQLCACPWHGAPLMDKFVSTAIPTDAVDSDSTGEVESAQRVLRRRQEKRETSSWVVRLSISH